VTEGEGEIDLFDVDRLRIPPELSGEMTGLRRPPRHKRGEAFLCGPIPFEWVAAACRLPGRGPHVALVLRFLRSRFRLGRDRRWSLDAIAKGLGVSDDSVRRGLREAELAGLISVARRPGCRVIAADVSMTRPSGGESDGSRPPLRGPVPWFWLSPALRLPGSALRVGIACWAQAGWEGSAETELALGEWTGLGLSRFSAGRGLDTLAEAGLVSVARRPGLPLVVTLRDPRPAPERGVIGGVG
jgi:hypothetical protein